MNMAEASDTLVDKVAMVTGASTGIGLETARAFASAGARVVMIARRAAELRRAAAEVGPKALALPADVAATDAIDRIVEEAERAVGVPDYLVTAAGICVPGLLDTLTTEEFDRHLRVNVTGSFHIGRRVALKMAARGSGSIVFVGSEQSHFGMGYYTAYATSKHAIIGLARCFAAELAPKGVRVNAVCPGPVDTPMLESEIQWFGGGDDIREGAWTRVPLRRLARPEEIARAILFLAQAPFATGAALDIDGGTTMT